MYLMAVDHVEVGSVVKVQANKVAHVDLVAAKGVALETSDGDHRAVVAARVVVGLQRDVD